MTEQPAALWAILIIFSFFFFNYIFIQAGTYSHGDSVPAAVRLSIRLPLGYSTSRQLPRRADIDAEPRGRAGGSAQQSSAMSGGGPPSPRVAEAGRHAGTTPGKRRRGPGVAKGQGPSARPREPRRGQRRESGVPGPGEQSAPLRGASTALPPLYGLGSRLQRRARHGCARRLRSSAGRAGLGSPEAAFYPPKQRRWT